jgi:hypothetical protein
MNPTEFLRVVDRAALMDDHWLFLAAFCLLLSLCGTVIFWLVKQLQAVIVDHKTLHEAHNESLGQTINTQNAPAPGIRRAVGTVAQGTP